MIYLGCILSPPSLQDDVDAVQAQIARNMLTSGDWVTARLDGVIYLEKPPLIYWLIAGSYKIFGVHDWAARIPVALSSIALALLVTGFGIWAFGKRAGLYAGLCISTCIGLWLFTRVLIPDVMLAGSVTLALWAFLRALDEQEPHPRRWAMVLALSLGVGLLWKSTIGLLFPLAAGMLYLWLTGQLFSAGTWKRLRVFSGAIIVLVIAAPWHLLATLRNPPYFVWTLHSGPGEYKGFLWFFFINEQLLRFLNLRYPRDYNTVPRLYFWLFHLLWLFPWSAYLPAAARLSYKPVDRAGRTRLLALCWVGFVLIFFSFSTTQEYYSMPAYPALALLLGSAMAVDGRWVRAGTKALGLLTGLAALAGFAILFVVRHVPTPGDISEALRQHPGVYSLSLGHMQDLTLNSFAYLRLPLAVAAIAFLAGAVGTLFGNKKVAIISTVLMMILFYGAAQMALVKFDPYLSSRPLAEALEESPPGTLIGYHHYYPLSSLFFYANRTGYLLEGRRMNLEYGSNAPGAPDVFLDDARFKQLWLEPQRSYLALPDEFVPRLDALVGSDKYRVVARSGGKLLVTNDLSLAERSR